MPALPERPLAKTVSTIAAVAGALHRRGVEATLATPAAGTGMAVFGHGPIFVRSSTTRTRVGLDNLASSTSTG